MRVAPPEDDAGRYRPSFVRRSFMSLASMARIGCFSGSPSTAFTFSSTAITGSSSVTGETITHEPSVICT